MNFDDFFLAATGNRPYDYQCRLACGDDSRSEEPETLSRGCECRSLLIDVPAGLGKIAAVVRAWFWNRLASSLARGIVVSLLAGRCQSWCSTVPPRQSPKPLLLGETSSK